MKKKSFQSKKKTVLITGAPLAKSLHLARTMGQAGHRVIVADKDWKHLVNASRFSTYVTKFVSLPNDVPYDDALVQIWEEENVDFFLPVSHIHLAVDDIKAKIKMQARAAELNRPFSDLAINNLEVIEELDDKDRFLQKSQEMGLPVPDFKTFFGQDLSVELGALRSEGMLKVWYIRLSKYLMHSFKVPLNNYSNTFRKIQWQTLFPKAFRVIKRRATGYD